MPTDCEFAMMTEAKHISIVRRDDSKSNNNDELRLSTIRFFPDTMSSKKNGASMFQSPRRRPKAPMLFGPELPPGFLMPQEPYLFSLTKSKSVPLSSSALRRNNAEDQAPPRKARSSRDLYSHPPRGGTTDGKTETESCQQRPCDGSAGGREGDEVPPIEQRDAACTTTTTATNTTKTGTQHLPRSASAEQQIMMATGKICRSKQTHAGIVTSRARPRAGGNRGEQKQERINNESGCSLDCDGRGLGSSSKVGGDIFRLVDHISEMSRRLVAIADELALPTPTKPSWTGTAGQLVGVEKLVLKNRRHDRGSAPADLVETQPPEEDDDDDDDDNDNNKEIDAEDLFSADLNMITNPCDDESASHGHHGDKRVEDEEEQDGETDDESLQITRLLEAAVSHHRKCKEQKITQTS